MEIKNGVDSKKRKKIIKKKNKYTMWCKKEMVSLWEKEKKIRKNKNEN